MGRRLTRAELDRRNLRRRVVQGLGKQGFSLDGSVLIPPKALDKSALRQLHAAAVKHRLELAEPYLRKLEPRLLQRIANGYEIVPRFIKPKLVQVHSKTDDEILFRYISLHWSIPVSSGYGRRLRFLVVDEQNDKVMGAFGLGDPVFNLGARDVWIGWTQEERSDRLHNVMEAFLVGAVPPYSYLLGGKLVAMLMASTEVRRAFTRKYSSARSLIGRRDLDGRLVLITTISALGRSSVYNRLSYRGEKLLQGVGFTAGFGDFHFANGLYTAIKNHAELYCEPTARADRWGNGGFRNRREVIKKCLVDLRLPSDWVHHGIQREVFVMPLGAKARAYLRGEVQRPHFYDQNAHDLADYWRDRWALPRAEWDRDYLAFLNSSYRLWPDK